MNNRELFNKIESHFNNEVGASEAYQTWCSATNNAADSCNENKKEIFDESGSRSDAYIAYAFSTIFSCLDDGYEGQEVFVSLGFKY